MDIALFDADGKPVPKVARAVVKALGAADPALGLLIGEVGPFALELHSLHNPYRALARAIIGQQITGKAAIAIGERVRLAFRARTFPTPAQMLEATDEELRACGLSGNKARALKDLAAKTLDRTVPSLVQLRKLPDEVIIERLTAVRGVGAWTVQMMLMFKLGRADVMPSTDYGVRKGFGRVFLRGEMPSPKDVEARGERWRPFRSVASWYLWRALELP